jgi:hypothetical protein
MFFRNLKMATKLAETLFSEKKYSVVQNDLFDHKST